MNCSFFERIVHSLIFVQKTSDLLGKPMSEFRALVIKTEILEYICDILRKLNKYQLPVASSTAGGGPSLVPPNLISSHRELVNSNQLDINSNQLDFNSNQLDFNSN